MTTLSFTGPWLPHTGGFLINLDTWYDSFGQVMNPLPVLFLGSAGQCYTLLKIAA
jgi:hypothetical protein